MAAGEHRFNTELQKRLFDARKELERQIGDDVTLEMIAQGIGRILGEPPPYFSTVGKWMQGQEPSMARQMWALAKFLHRDPGDLLFGGTPGNRPIPPIPTSRSGQKPRRLARKAGELAVEQPHPKDEGPADQPRPRRALGPRRRPR